MNAGFRIRHVATAEQQCEEVKVTTFTLDSSAAGCTGATCSATVAGDHTVTETNGAAHGTATLHVTAGMLDHLVLSPVKTCSGSRSRQSGKGCSEETVDFDERVTKRFSAIHGFPGLTIPFS